VTGRHLGIPVIPGIPIADMSVGIFLAFAALAGMMARERTGEGQYIDIPMTDIMVAYNMFHVGVYLSQSEAGEELNITGDAPFYEVFKTKDGKFISFGNVEKKFWDNFCEAIGRVDLKPHQFAVGSRKDEMMSELRELFLSKRREEWLALFKGKEVCCTPVNSVEEVFHDPHVMELSRSFSL
jgi:crotonobetainyl-CoA:carnitine CoA-transferase CaiB-like acyl-CoA transferase